MPSWPKFDRWPGALAFQQGLSTFQDNVEAAMRAISWRTSPFQIFKADLQEMETWSQEADLAWNTVRTRSLRPTLAPTRRVSCELGLNAIESQAINNGSDIIDDFRGAMGASDMAVVDKRLADDRADIWRKGQILTLGYRTFETPFPT